MLALLQLVLLAVSRSDGDDAMLHAQMGDAIGLHRHLKRRPAHGSGDGRRLQFQP
jgi:hypothetical protein